MHSSLTGSHDHILLQGQIFIFLTVKATQLAYTMCEDMLAAMYPTIFVGEHVCTDLSACTTARQTRWWMGPCALRQVNVGQVGICTHYHCHNNMLLIRVHRTYMHIVNTNCLWLHVSVATGMLANCLGYSQ